MPQSIRVWPHATPRRRRTYSARPFFATILLLSAIALLVLLLDRTGLRSSTDEATLLSRSLHVAHNQECRLVHQAKDKCAFVRANCPDEEAGILSYLQFYYCRLPNAKPVAFTILIVWLGVLFSTIGIAASDFFCVNLSTIASLLGMSESMAGVTFLAFGNGSPDVFSTFAAMNTNSGSLAVGELIGAAGFISAVVAGSMAMVRPFKVDRKPFVRDVGFFIVAATFSMVFLVDGKLYLWECAAMVGFYIFYVVFVVAWHWYFGRRHRRKMVEAAARANFVNPHDEEIEPLEPYHDDETDHLGDRPRVSRGPSFDEFAALERGDADEEHGMEEANEEERERWLGELNSLMRLGRPPTTDRKPTKRHRTRPSLVGALEFRAVLASLKKSRNIQSQPINLRRYSDDPTYTTAQQQDHLSTEADPAARPTFEIQPGDQDSTPSVTRPNADIRQTGPNRARAVSANDAESLKLDPNLRKSALQQRDLLGPVPEDEAGLKPPSGLTTRSRGSSGGSMGLPSPTISLSPPPSLHDPNHGGQRGNLSPVLRGQQPSPRASPQIMAQSGSPSMKPQKDSTSVRARALPKLSIPGSPRQSPITSPLPTFVDYPWSLNSGSRPGSIRFAPPSTSPQSLYPNEHYVDDEEEERPLPWWPHKVLPPPRRLLKTLFPTLYNWRDKNIWDKLLGAAAAPAVFLLTITLPVVEAEKDEEEEERERIPELSLPDAHSPLLHAHVPPGPSSITIIEPPEDQRHGNGDISFNSRRSQSITGHADIATIAVSNENQHLQRYHDESPPAQDGSGGGYFAHTAAAARPKHWDRWLIILQSFTAPFFIVLILWANTDPSNPRALLKPTLIALLCSLILLLLILFTTTPSRPPKWHPLLCFAGFLVSIAWISSIAGEVVGVLKTLGAILNISDAILGLTVFAVGNSLGDLVADITVARLGFPVMALSACFGGPMLNILLGVGISGCWITIRGAERKKERHPEKGLRFKPYHLDISSTLLISGITLLVTLAGLLVIVPMRKWRMDRFVGVVLIAVWAVSTVMNVVAEVAGWEGSVN
ncbi:hypothetical protein K490DRAFT_71134 [Saccharata proteae CBS 121410]|uniref:Sodium/calcium exchanger membrane region domain-containing protein n=1 Tax=Saccharata proteae CBS 121410 TaxID=1314787 RepID=A0A9P4HZP4_9PEZI|nr:hypothetical protein K490DRAFT_71134 [Saccharata proteae CBS 121410]